MLGVVAVKVAPEEMVQSDYRDALSVTLSLFPSPLGAYKLGRGEGVASEVER